MPDPHSSSSAPWLGLVIGNTRLHWGLFQGEKLIEAWHTPHLEPSAAEQLRQQQFAANAWQQLLPVTTESLPLPFLNTVTSPLALYCVSVAPSQTALWERYAHFQEIQLRDLPLENSYPTLGIDRALNLLEAADCYGWPMLVIDAGTALTFTAGDRGQLVGGAILPGLSTQFAAIAQHAAALPVLTMPQKMPLRWSTNTPDAIRSGIIYGALATLQDFCKTWRSQYPNGQAVLTGGDAAQLLAWLGHQGEISWLHHEPNLTLKGLGWAQRYNQPATDYSS